MISRNHAVGDEQLINSLHRALATEVVCVLRYTSHYYQAMKLGATNLSKLFLETLKEEKEHVDKLAERIFQLGAIPRMDLAFLEKNSRSRYVECDTVECLIQENLAMEREAIENYRQLIEFIQGKDITTQRIIESILASEEEHETELLVLEAEENHLKTMLSETQEKHNLPSKDDPHSQMNSARTIYLDPTLSTPRKIELLTGLENEIQNRTKATEEGMFPNKLNENDAKEMQIINNLLMTLKKSVHKT
jgi:bacterioferritin